MLYFHGVGEDLGEVIPEMYSLMYMCEVNVLGVEYPGFGLHWNQGKCSS